MAQLSRIQRLWYVLEQQRAQRKRRLAQAIITTALKAAAFGDSITLQNTTSNTLNKILNAVGYIVMYNFLARNRVKFSVADNYGIGGGDLSSMDARKATDLAGKGYNIIFFCGGANDVPAATLLAQMKSFAFSIITYIASTLNILCVVLVIPPRTQEGGVPLTQDMRNKQLAFNAWLLSLDNNKNILVVDYYADLTIDGVNPNPDYFKNETGKLLHPNPKGAFIMARKIKARLDPVIGSASSPAVGAILPVGSFNGTAGILGSNASGQVATGWSGSGSGGTNGRVFSKNPDGSQRVLFSLPDGAGTSPSLTLQAVGGTNTGYAVGDTFFGWIDITMHNGSNADGPYLECRDVAASTYNKIGMNKAGQNTGFMPLNDMGRGLIHTEDFIVQAGNTRLDMLIRAQLYAIGQPASMEFTVHAAGFMKVA